MRYSLCIFLLLLPFLRLDAQPGWKLAKDKNGIRVYLASGENSKYKSMRVQCTIGGTIAKLQNALRDVTHHPKWVYNAKNGSLLKKSNPNDFIYYLETEMPWPVTNRDGAYHVTMNYDSLHHSLLALVIAEPNDVVKKDGLIRIPYSRSAWNVTEADKKISIDYTLEVDPGGSLPAWLVNLFADKGPYESFRRLEHLLQQ